MKTWQEMSKEVIKLSNMDSRAVLGYLVGYCSDDIHFLKGLDWALKQVNKSIEVQS
jgi:hypothetical protein